MKAKIIFPKEAKKVKGFRKMFKKQEYLLPGWLRRLTVIFSRQPNPEAAESKASADCDYAYLKAEIIIYPPFWNLDDDERALTIKHEIIHICVWPLFDTALQYVDKLANKDQKAMHDLLVNRIYDVNEMIAEELCMKL